eukprot:TRINITY_DN14896_c0_g1_i1.p1 TRINITY_DN14896_c0_g1~~TRINITY_DN14896_c0_g1_i1.p1  ORF type:complete len:1066 (+),score=182.62 TRINITY_DN14896_c0_g1_i1:84-3281(+)
MATTTSSFRAPIQIPEGSCSLFPACSGFAGKCCPTDTGIVLDCCPKYARNPVGSWMAVGVCAAILLAALVGTLLHVRRSGGFRSTFAHDVGVALAAGVMYLLLAVPLIERNFFDALPLSLQNNYVWLPFWYCFVLTKQFGSFLEVAWQSYAGSLMTLVVMVLINYMMPGGAGPFGHTEKAQKNAWVPGGYHEWLVYVLAAAYVYSVHFSTWSVSTKQYALGFFAGCIVSFMDPEQDAQNFEAVFVNYHGQIQWGSFVLSQYYVMFLAVPLAACTILLVVPCYRNFSHKLRAASEISNISLDTASALERLIAYFKQGASKSNMSSSQLFIRQLGSRRVSAQTEMVQAKWEVCGRSKVKEALSRMEVIAKMQQDLRHFLRALLVNMQQPDMQEACQKTVWTHLDSYVNDIRSALAILAEATQNAQWSSETVAKVQSYTRSAEGWVEQALRLLEKPQEKESRKAAHWNFVDGLRTCPRIIEAAVQKAEDADSEDDEDSEESSAEDENIRRSKRSHGKVTKESFMEWLFWRRIRSCKNTDQHLSALRNTVSWMIALVWSTWGHDGYSASCVTAVSFLFAPSLGSLFIRNQDRILGVSLGLSLGTVPWVVLTNPICASSQLWCFYELPQGLLLYLFAMFLMWTIPIYGYVATGSKHSYAYLLWAGFGGVLMMKKLLYQQHASQVMNSFQDQIDNLMGCMIVFVVDWFFATFTGRRNIDSLKHNVEQSFHNAAQLMDHIQDYEQKEGAEDLETLRESIIQCRFFYEESEKEEMIWSTTSIFQVSFINALLDHLDDLYVSCWSLLDNMGRLKARRDVASIVSLVLPEYLSFNCRLYAEVIRVYSLGGIADEDADGSSLPNPREYDTRSRVLSGDTGRSRFLSGGTSERIGSLHPVSDDDQIEPNPPNPPNSAGLSGVLGSLRRVSTVLLRAPTHMESEDFLGSLSSARSVNQGAQASSLIRGKFSRQLCRQLSSLMQDTTDSAADDGHMPSLPQTSELTRVEALALGNKAWALRTTLRKVEVLLKEHLYWCAKGVEDEQGQESDRPETEQDLPDVLEQAEGLSDEEDDEEDV